MALPSAASAAFLASVAFVSAALAVFSAPVAVLLTTFSDEGKVGDVYYYQEKSFYFKIKVDGNPLEHNWYFPMVPLGDKY